MRRSQCPTAPLRTVPMSCCKLKRALTLFPRSVRSMWRVAPLLAVGAVAAPDTVLSQATPVSGLTSISGIEVGHFTLVERPTGCTVILVGDGAVAGGEVRGAAPSTRETDLLDPVNTIQEAHAVVLAGGSAFGLSAADGVMRFLEENGIGVAFGGVLPGKMRLSTISFSFLLRRVRPWIW